VVAAAGLAALPATGAAAPAVGLNTAGNSLWLFDTATPGTMTAVPITGLGVGEAMDGIDRRPSTGALYGLGVVDGGAMDMLRLYRIDPTTGAATPVGVAPVTAPAGGTDYGVDFNPLTDRLRVVNDGNENLRLNPNNGALAGDDADLTDGAPPDSRPIEGIAYSSNVAPPFGAGGGVGSTTVFGIAPNTDELVTIGGFGGSVTSGPNGGVIGDEKPLAFNAISTVNFDIADFSPTGFLTSTANFGTVNLGTGTFTLIGILAHQLGGFTVLPATTVTLDPRAVTTSEAAGAVTIPLTRSGMASAASVRVTTEQNNLGVSETDTATPGEDYQPLDIRVNVVGDQAQVTIPIEHRRGRGVVHGLPRRPRAEHGPGRQHCPGRRSGDRHDRRGPRSAAPNVGHNRPLRRAHPRRQVAEARDAGRARAHRALRLRRGVRSDFHAQAQKEEARHGEGSAHQGRARPCATQAVTRREPRARGGPQASPLRENDAVSDAHGRRG
jgi:hypothetical protein